MSSIPTAASGRSWHQLAALACTLLFGAPAWGAEGKVEVPLEIGVGPATHTWFGGLGLDQPVHMGIVVTNDIVLDRDWLRDNGDQVPQRWRSRLGYLDEVRVRPLWYLPESLVLSPRFRLQDNTDIDFDGDRTEARPSAFMVGASWRPVSVGLPIITWPVRVSVNAAPRLTLLYVNEGDPDRVPNTTDTRKTFFIRPGADLTADVVVPITEDFRLRAGLDGQVYLPQELGGFGIGRQGERMAFLMRSFVEVRYRVPISVRR